jgi:hypothetical protein
MTVLKLGVIEDIVLCLFSECQWREAADSRVPSVLVY